MQQLTEQGLQALQNIAQRYQISIDAARTMLDAVSAGGGTMAQFYIPELGGNGQWMQGGMTMVGDMFNNQLKNTVNNLCGELSALLRNQQVYEPQTQGNSMTGNNAWWPAQLGQPNASGGQNDTQYAYFAQAHRLAIRSGQQVTVYDTLNHQIGGVQQQSGPYQPLSFSSQFGTFDVSSLPLAAEHSSPSSDNVQANLVSNEPVQAEPQAASGAGKRAELGSEEIFRAIEQLGQLHQQGILSDSEFTSKKAELLARL